MFPKPLCGFVVILVLVLAHVRIVNFQSFFRLCSFYDLVFGLWYAWFYYEHGNYTVKIEVNTLMFP